MQGILLVFHYYFLSLKVCFFIETVLSFFVKSRNKNETNFYIISYFPRDKFIRANKTNGTHLKILSEFPKL